MYSGSLACRQQNKLLTWARTWARSPLLTLSRELDRLPLANQQHTTQNAVLERSDVARYIDQNLQFNSTIQCLTKSVHASQSVHKHFDQCCACGILPYNGVYMPSHRKVPDRAALRALAFRADRRHVCHSANCHLQRAAANCRANLCCLRLLAWRLGVGVTRQAVQAKKLASHWLAPLRLCNAL